MLLYPDSPLSSPDLSPLSSPYQSPATTPSTSPYSSPKSDPSQLDNPDKRSKIRYLGLVQEQLAVRISLTRRLKEFSLRGMTGGFPFRLLHDGAGNALVSFDNYEFQEPITGGNGRSNPIVSFTNPASVFAGSNSGLFCWRICLPTSEKQSCLRSQYGSSSKLLVAEVRMDPSLHNTSYFRSEKIAYDVFTALAASLETGFAITIQWSQTRAGFIEWEATDSENRTRVLREFAANSA